MQDTTAVTQTLVPHSLANRALDEELLAAMSVNALIARVDKGTLWVASKIFAASRDKRVKRGGCLFLAHLLCFSRVDQLSLFPGTEVGDVAQIAIPNILKLCRDKKNNGWPWCYDTTLKYLELLKAAGVLVTRPDEPGIYYLPLGPYALLSEHSSRQVEHVARKRSKVSRSTAFRRTAIHCSLLGEEHPFDEGEMVDSPNKDIFLVDEQEVQQMVQVICNAIQRCQGVTLLPTTMIEVTRLVAKRAARIVRKGNERVITTSKEEARQLLLASRSTSGAQDQEKVVDSRKNEAITSHYAPGYFHQETPQNLPSGSECEQSDTTESTKTQQNLSSSNNMVDSSTVVFSEFSNITNNKANITDDILSEAAHAQESTIHARSTQVGDSPDASRTETPGLHPASLLASPFSLSTMLFWRFAPAVQHLEPGETELLHLASLLSRRFNGDDQKVGHYLKLLGDDFCALDVAVIDSLVRSYFPDPRHKPDMLRGAWVTRQYKAYHTGTSVPAEIRAWADTPYTYDAIQSVLAAAAQWQSAQGKPRKRPLPQEVIVSSLQLTAFWANGAGQSLKSQGYVGVDVDGDLLTCDEYEQHRQDLLVYALDTDPLALSDEVAAEVEAYRAWIEPGVCDRQEAAYLLSHLPQQLMQELGKLERVLDAERYRLSVQVELLSRRRVICVQEREDPGRDFLLFKGGHVDVFLRRYQRMYPPEMQGDEPEAAAITPDHVDSVASPL